MNATMDTEDEFRVSLRVRNNRLLSVIDESGLSVPKFCKLHDLPYMEIIQMVSLKLSPVYPRGGWRGSVLKLADAIGCLPEELFPEATCVAIKKAEATFTLNAREAEAFLEEASRPDLLAEKRETETKIAEALDSLPARCAQVLRMRFGIGTHEHSLEEVGQKFDVGRERIRQIEAKALRMLRAPKRSEPLRWLLDSSFIEKPSEETNEENDSSDWTEDPYSKNVAPNRARDPSRSFYVTLVGGEFDGKVLVAPPGARAFVVNSTLHYAPQDDVPVPRNEEVRWHVVCGEPPVGAILKVVG